MVGGQAAALESVRWVFEPIAAKIVLMGGSGAGHSTKLLNNFLNAVTLAATAEVMVAAPRPELDLAAVLDVINSSSGVSFATTNRFPHIIKGDYLEGGLTSNLMTKDVVAYVDHVRELGVPCLNAAGPLASFGAAANLGYGELISNRVVDAIGDLAGGVRLHSAGEVERAGQGEGTGGRRHDGERGRRGGRNGHRLRRPRQHGHPDDPSARRGRAPGARVRHVGRGAAGVRGHRASDTGGGVTAVAELGAVGDGAAAVILMLPDSDIVERVLLGGLASDPADRSAGRRAARQPAPGAIVIDMSSSDPARTQVLAELVASAGVTLIDAPVSGGVVGARAGAWRSWSAARPRASRGSSQCWRHRLTGRACGRLGAGHAVKALNNLMSAANLLAGSEALVAGRRFGLDPAVMLEIVNGSSGRSSSTENKWPDFVLTEKYDAGFSARLMVKDIKLALSIEHATGVPSAASEAVVATWEEALAELGPDADHTAIARWLESRGWQQAARGQGRSFMIVAVHRKGPGPG